uniref:Uncharacterized protein n=1 Tax=Oryza punctata TaxID=4537 RepID=A0A0E0L9Z3_ORYPU
MGWRRQRNPGPMRHRLQWRRRSRDAGGRMHNQGDTGQRHWRNFWGARGDGSDVRWRDLRARGERAAAV